MFNFHEVNNMWRKVILLLVVVLQFFIFSSAEAADHDLLKGLKGVKIVIEPLPEAVKQINLTKDEIRRDVELKLRQAGIKILAENSTIATPGPAILSVKVTLKEAFEDTSVLYFGDMELFVKEFAILEREKIRGLMVTWTRGSSFLAGQVNAKEGCRKTIMKLLNTFLNDYLKANPKSAQKQ
jgi:hypothetical protein